MTCSSNNTTQHHWDNSRRLLLTVCNPGTWDAWERQHISSSFTYSRQCVEYLLFQLLQSKGIGCIWTSFLSCMTPSCIFLEICSHYFVYVLSIYTVNQVGMSASSQQQSMAKVILFVCWTKRVGSEWRLHWEPNGTSSQEKARGTLLTQSKQTGLPLEPKPLSMQEGNMQYVQHWSSLTLRITHLCTKCKHNWHMVYSKMLIHLIYDQLD